MREKLIELLNIELCPHVCIGSECPYFDSERCYYEKFADHLIANGVTVQRWIPVTERLPEKTGKYLVCRADGTMITNFYYVGQDDFVTRTFPVVTHWMPLPTPPKDGDIK